MNACKILELATRGDIDKIIELAKQEITQKTVKEKYGINHLKRFKTALKYLKKMEKFHPEFSKVWAENNLQCFTNGYTAFILKNHIENLPTISEEKSFCLEPLSIINPQKMRVANIDIADIRAKLKIEKAEKKHKYFTCIYDIGESYYNAEYLIDCYTILGGDNIQFWQPKNGELIPSIFESENGKAIILPVKKT